MISSFSFGGEAPCDIIQPRFNDVSITFFFNMFQAVSWHLFQLFKGS